jgi:hypothetical protein
MCRVVPAGEILHETTTLLHQAPPRPSGHPFGQTPFLTDAGADLWVSFLVSVYVCMYVCICQMACMCN